MSEIVKPDENKLITVGNECVKARYSMKLIEKRLLWLFIASINNDINKTKGIDKLEVIDPTKEYFVRVEDYAALYNIKYESAKNELAEAVDELFQREVTYTRADGENITTRWISSKVIYVKGEHRVGLKWAVDIIPLISELRGNFTSYRLRHIKSLPSVYSLRFYEFFNMELNRLRRGKLKIYIPFDELRSMFVIPNDQYTRSADFIRTVIELPINHINNDENADIEIMIEDEDGKRMYRKHGKKIVGLNFMAFRKKKGGK